VHLEQPAQAVAFLRERGVYVTEKPEGARISTHFYNNEHEVDTCVDALVAYRDHVPV
jgi:selenocysteine lyase/cysteine desulfurase